MNNIKEKALSVLHLFIGEGTDFRDGQYEAIEATLNNKRTLVVQRTGWGKSMVYFVCTKILRDEGKGVTLIVSPLLSLMNNQMQAAKNAGLKCHVLNSSVNSEDKESIFKQMQNNEVDLVLTTPETLFNEDFQKALPTIKIGLFVIDEAHCISDWGHDFRLEYCKLNKIINKMMRNVPILATTATANNRVVDDLKAQLGGDVFISRGPLMRDNLSIQILKMKDKASRYAWILENINKLEGSGIIYCLTQDDCNELAEFLIKNKISAKPYHSGLDKNINAESEELFMNDSVKVLVATVKLGMGYDKSNIAFVIHYQSPSNIVAYYQQIGRAGRNIDRANTFLMCGEEDLDIQNYFIETAFPSEDESRAVMEIVSLHEGIGKNDLKRELNISDGRIDKALSFLENEEFIYKEKNKTIKYYASANVYKYNSERYETIKNIRRLEQQQMIQLMNIDSCLNRYIVNCLDDDTECNCNICSNCLGRDIISSEISNENFLKAQSYLNDYLFKIEPRKKWADSKKINLINEEGICLSRYGHQGYGKMVRDSKYTSERYCNELVYKSAEVLKKFIKENGIQYITCVPSLRNNMVQDFAIRLSEILTIPFVDTLRKTNSKQQKEMENSFYQCKNALDSFSINDDCIISGKYILIDDIVDSKWTITVCGNLLRKAGAENVFPFALASSSKKEG